jgi:hypothetical protein
LWTEDGTLRSALGVALSARGIELLEAPPPEPASSSDEAWGRAAGLDADAVVWLCALGDGEHGVCLYDRQRSARRVRRLAVPSPLSPADAAGVALSVRVLLSPAPVGPAATTQRPDAELPRSPLLAPVAPPDEYWLTVEATGGARLWQFGSDRLAARAGVTAAIAPDRWHRRLAAGLGLTLGPDESTGISSLHPDEAQLSDVTLRGFGRLRTRLGPLSLELDLGPAVHVLTLSDRDERGMSASVSETTTALALEGAAGLVLPLGSFYTALRLGGFVRLTGGLLGASSLPSIEMPDLGADLLLSLGVGFR